MSTGYEGIDSHLFVRDGDELKSDPLADDLTLVINADCGLVVILGCTHRDIVNTLRHAQNLTSKELVYAVIGGTHLIGASEERIELTIADLSEMGIQRLGVSHCTGFRSSTRLFSEIALENKIKPPIGNRIIYPDGTVNSFVERYLQERVVKLFEAKQKRPAKKKITPSLDLTFGDLSTEAQNFHYNYVKERRE